ncbi:MAG: hypothetical protein GY847_07480, partial [Proteobacteria bacterium]|nr:hypothetical protein [Pseudomonadota bacterium]
CDGSARRAHVHWQNWGLFQKKATWQKAGLALMLLGLMCCCAAMVWSCVVCFACFCKACLTPPLPILTGLATLFFLIGVTIVGVKTKTNPFGDIGGVGDVKTSVTGLDAKNDIGYSMWLGIGAIVVMFVDTIIGIILVKVSKVSPI